MPLYSISHATSLSDEQQDQLAEGITKIHTNLFAAPRLFVNVHFSPASDYKGYVGGKRKQANIIRGRVRHGPSRTPVMYEELMNSINKLWGEVVSACLLPIILQHVMYQILRYRIG
jgi:phenylpyruvate tautomerase PptA (4-oxalocrotonate tautomerase family)